MYMYIFPFSVFYWKLFNVIAESFQKNIYKVVLFQLGACSGASVSCSTFDLNSNKECHWGDVFYITDFYKDKR